MDQAGTDAAATLENWNLIDELPPKEPGDIWYLVSKTCGSWWQRYSICRPAGIECNIASVETIKAQNFVIFSILHVDMNRAPAIRARPAVTRDNAEGLTEQLPHAYCACV